MSRTEERVRPPHAPSETADPRWCLGCLANWPCAYARANVAKVGTNMLQRAIVRLVEPHATGCGCEACRLLYEALDEIGQGVMTLVDVETVIMDAARAKRAAVLGHLHSGPDLEHP